MKLEFLNEFGENESIDVIEIYEYEGKRYALVVEDEEGEAYIYELCEEDEGVSLLAIEDEDLYNELFELIQEDLDAEDES